MDGAIAARAAEHTLLILGASKEGLLSSTSTQDLIDRRVADLHVPAGMLVALVRRDGQILVPSGSTVLEEVDRITVIGNPAGIDRLCELYRAVGLEGAVR